MQVVARRVDMTPEDWVSGSAFQLAGTLGLPTAERISQWDLLTRMVEHTVDQDLMPDIRAVKKAIGRRFPEWRYEKVAEIAEWWYEAAICTLAHQTHIIMPVYRYDHGMTALSTTPFRGHHAEWDSAQVGVIYVDRKEIRKGYRKFKPGEMENKVRESMSRFIQDLGHVMNGSLWEAVILDKHSEIFDYEGEIYYSEEEAKEAGERFLATLELEETEEPESDSWQALAKDLWHVIENGGINDVFFELRERFRKLCD